MNMFDWNMFPGDLCGDLARYILGEFVIIFSDTPILLTQYTLQTRVL